MTKIVKETKMQIAHSRKGKAELAAGLAQWSAWVESPIGLIQVTTSDSALLGVSRVGSGSRDGQGGGHVEAGAPGVLHEACRQLEGYFAGRLEAFTLPLGAKGSAFQMSVWRALVEIPYGQTRSYQQIARRIGNTKACRAVGLANGANPIMIVVPCHRVIGASGGLTGFGGGLDAKRWLLDHESGGLFSKVSKIETA